MFQLLLSSIESENWSIESANWSIESENSSVTLISILKTRVSSL